MCRSRERLRVIERSFTGTQPKEEGGGGAASGAEGRGAPCWAPAAGRGAGREERRAGAVRSPRPTGPAQAGRWRRSGLPGSRSAPAVVTRERKEYLRASEFEAGDTQPARTRRGAAGGRVGRGPRAALEEPAAHAHGREASRRSKLKASRRQGVGSPLPARSQQTFTSLAPLHGGGPPAHIPGQQLVLEEANAQGAVAHACQPAIPALGG